MIETESGYRYAQLCIASYREMLERAKANAAAQRPADTESLVVIALRLADMQREIAAYEVRTMGARDDQRRAS